jgi:hypothetical protein
MIEARGLVKRYGSTTAVDNLSFDVRCCCGSSGAVPGWLKWPRSTGRFLRCALGGPEARGQSPICWPPARPGLVGRWGRRIGLAAYVACSACGRWADAGPGGRFLAWVACGVTGVTDRGNTR